LRWNEFETNISESFRELREEKDFFDVTLACDDNQLQAHKVIISACSPFFRNVLRRNPHQHPLVYLKGVKYKDLLSVLNFMYLGEVNIAQEELNTFLTVAEDLEVKGLTQGNKECGPPLSKKQKQEAEPSVSKPKPITAKAIQQPLPVRHRTSPAPTQSNYAPPQRYQEEEQEIQEVIPVKSEPQEPAVLTEYQPEVQHDGGGGGGTVAVDDNYAGDDYYYQYEDTTTTTYQYAGTQEGKDLQSIILSKMYKNAEGEWQCNDCLKTSKWKTNIVEHIEATHVESPGYQCDQCYKFCRTRNALRNHKHLNHKQRNVSQ